MERVMLSEGNWAELRPVSDISEKARRPISKQVSQLSKEGLETMQKLVPYLEDKGAGQLELRENNLEELAKENIRFSEEDLERFSIANDYCIVALVKAWSYPEQISIDAVTNLKAVDYDRLRAVCAPAAGALFVDFSINPQPTSPFVGSNGSATPSTEGTPLTSASPTQSGETTSS